MMESKTWFLYSGTNQRENISGPSAEYKLPFNQIRNIVKFKTIIFVYIYDKRRVDVKFKTKLIWKF